MKPITKKAFRDKSNVSVDMSSQNGSAHNGYNNSNKSGYLSNAVATDNESARFSNMNPYKFNGSPAPPRKPPVNILKVAPKNAEIPRHGSLAPPVQAANPDQFVDYQQANNILKNRKLSLQPGGAQEKRENN